MNTQAATETAPLVTDLEVAESDEEEQAEHQPVRSRTMRRTGIALMVLGLVGAVLLVGTVHDQMVVANVGNAEAKWGFSSSLWDKVKANVQDHATTANAMVNAVKEHADNLDLGAHADNLVNTVKEQADNLDLGAQDHATTANAMVNAVKEHADNLVNTVKSHASDLHNAAENAILAPVCNEIKRNLPKLKLRWADKMAADLMGDKAVCGKDVKSEECTQSFVEDACPMGEGVRKTLCETIFTGVVKKIQAHIPQIVGSQTSAPWKNALNMEMPALDAKVKEFCK